jgi:hypothetical protein
MALVASTALAASAPQSKSPDATMEQFLQAMRQRDKEKAKPKLKAAFDWPALAQANFPDFQKQPEAKRQALITQVQSIFTAVFAMGKDADGMKMSKANIKGSEATVVLLRKDKDGKMLPTTEFKLHKMKDGTWLIFSVGKAEQPTEKKPESTEPAH